MRNARSVSHLSSSGPADTLERRVLWPDSCAQGFRAPWSSQRAANLATELSASALTRNLAQGLACGMVAEPKRIGRGLKSGEAPFRAHKRQSAVTLCVPGRPDQHKQSQPAPPRRELSRDRKEPPKLRAGSSKPPGVGVMSTERQHGRRHEHTGLW